MNCTNCNLSSVLADQRLDISSSDSGKLMFQVWAAVTSVLSITGTAATGTVAFVVWKVQSGSKWLIINYLFIHLVTSALNVPVNVYMTTLKNILNITPPNICPPFQLLYFSTEHGTDWANLCLAIHRIFAVRFPTKYAILTRRPVVVSMIVFTWVAAFSANVPYLFGVGGYFTVSPAGRCGMNVTDQTVVGLLYTTATMLPFGLSTIAALYLSLTLVWIRFNGGRQVQPRPQAGLQRRMRLAQALLAAVVIDAVCIKSWSIIGLYFPFVFVRFPVISLLTRTSVVVAATLAPILICLMNSDYRRQLLHLPPAAYVMDKSSTVGGRSRQRERIAHSKSRPVPP